MKRLERQLRARVDDESGVAMILVLGIGMLVAILVVAGLSYSLNGIRSAKSDQDWNSSLSAAYAGIEEYQSRIADDPSYVQYGNPDSTFSRTSASVVRLPPVVNEAFGVGASGSWASVPGSSDTSEFRYEVDNSTYTTDGILKIRSTGRVGRETRSIVANLKQEGFLDFVYFTDFEIRDPALSGVDVGTCVKYGWQGRPTTGCSDIAFDGGDTVKGPAHSNDAIRVCSARFTSRATTAYNPTSGVRYVARDSSYNSCSGQNFDVAAVPVANSPAYSPVVGMPATNSQLKKETREDLGSDVPRPGCLYTGPTSIKLNANGSITVRSPYTRKTNVSGDTSAGGTTPARCGTIGTSTNQLGSTGGATFDLPDNNVIYVQNVPAAATDVNFWAANAVPSGFSCTNAGGTGTGNGIGYPLANEYIESVSNVYGCRNGDVFVEGTVSGKATIAADNYVYVTGDIKYGDAQKDLLGLIGNGSIYVWNPGKITYDRNGNPNGYSAILTDSGRQIDAAILSVAHSFMVQNYNRGGARGTLTVNGAIAQKFRGPVAGSGGGLSGGYVKNYQYDSRFAYTAPPKFLSPVTTTYGVNIWVEVKPVFDRGGVYR